MTEHRPRVRAPRSLGRWFGWARPGTWIPGRLNLALLVIQLAALYQAGLRGRDYLEPRSEYAIDAQGLGVLDNAAALPIWGWLFYLSAAVVLVGLAGRWIALVVTGHAALFAWYGGVAIGILQDQGVRIDWQVGLGALCAGLGTWLIFQRRAPGAPVRLLLGVPGMLVGQELLSSGLGEDYRTGTGLMGAAVIHLTLAAGSWLLVKRETLTEQVEREVGVALPRG